MKKDYLSPFLFLALMAVIGACNSVQTTTPTSLEDFREGFADPTGTARAKVYWWWLNGYTDRTRIKEELKAIKDAGLGGVDIFEIGFRPDGVVPAGPAFMSDSSLNEIAFAIREANQLGLEVGLNLSSSWNAGGSWVKPEHAAKTLYVSKTTVSGPSSGAITLPFPKIGNVDANGKPRLMAFQDNGRPVFSQEVAVLALPVKADPLDTTEIVDVTSYFDVEKDLLNWQAPAGNWEIHRYVCSNTGENLLLPSPNSHGPIIDHFDASATEAHFMHFIKGLKSKLGEDLSQSGLKNLYLASFEARTTIWTPTMQAEFKRLNGYEINKFLPLLFNPNAFTAAAAEEFNRGLRLTISELMINNHYRKGSEIANLHGLKLISESGGPGPPLHNVPVEAIKALGALDTPRGEFWINHARLDHSPDSIDLLMLVKEIAAASHIYEQKITELEAFTSFQNWREGPGDMKPIGDRAFCEGMNRAVIHGFTHNPPGMGAPGIVYYAGTHFNDKTTWWPKVKPFNDYLARISYILQETDFVADVLYYYGDKTPNFVTPKNTRFTAGSGYDYEIINTEILLRDITVKDGFLTLPYGARFKVLALDAIEADNKVVLAKIEALRKQGAIITDTRLANVSNALKAADIVPDFDYPDKQSERLDYMKPDHAVLDYIHHKKGNLDFYFIRNTRNEWITRNCRFRQENKSPELWDPVTGFTHQIPVFDQKSGQTEVPLTFAPYGSYLIVFNPAGQKAVYTALEDLNGTAKLAYEGGDIFLMDTASIRLQTTEGVENRTFSPARQTLAGPWQVAFTEEWGAPKAATFPELISWTESLEEGIKYYSGTATYEKTFTHTSGAEGTNRIYLDLGSVARVADAWLNGEPLGITWTPPYRYDVTAHLKPGENHLRIEVINTWANRIIGDLNSAAPYTNTNVKERATRELKWSEAPLLTSGLLGPVTLQTHPAITGKR